MLIKAFCLVLLCLTFCSQATLLDDFVSSIPEAHEEVDKVIIKEFLKERHAASDTQGLVKEFQNFKRQWTERMVDFLIQELDINEEGAREARKNPDSFYINYDTYKLFTSFI